MRQAYRALNGLNYPGRKGEVRADVGDIIEDLPASAIPDLLAQGDIEAVTPEAEA